MEVLIETYDYLDDNFNFINGQIVRFQALNGTGAAAGGGDCCFVGSRVPSIWAEKSNGENLLHVTSAISNDLSSDNGNWPGNFVFNFKGEDAPDIDKYFNITITQLPTALVINNLYILFLFNNSFLGFTLGIHRDNRARRQTNPSAIGTK